MKKSAPVESLSNTILVTGATGFLGCEIVKAARLQGKRVIAIYRSVTDQSQKLIDIWESDPEITPIQVDIAAEGAYSELLRLLNGVSTVIHAAARLSGSDTDHERDTVRGTDILINAILHNNKLHTNTIKCNIILISSFSVYGYLSLEDNALVDENTDIEIYKSGRDAYCRAKIEQERLVEEASKRTALRARILRVSVIYGVGRMWTPLLGFRFWKFVFCPNPDAIVPAIEVSQCAAAVVLAANTNTFPDENVSKNLSNTPDVINLVSPNSPTRREWLEEIGQHFIISVPFTIFTYIAKLSSGTILRIPGLKNKLPTILREASMQARFKSLRYSPMTSREKLGIEIGGVFKGQFIK